MKPRLESTTETLNSTLEAFADERRRAVVRYFREGRDRSASRAELAEFVSATASVQAATGNVDRRLHHVGLPKLEAAGIIEYDARQGTVRYRPGVVDDGLLARVLGDE